MLNIKHLPSSISLMLILLLSSAISAWGQAYPSWGSLESGKHKVGFKTIATYDTTRIYKPSQGIKYRPLLIHLWYPTNESSNRYMPYAAYIQLETQRENFMENKADAERYANQVINGYIEYGKKLMDGLAVTPHEVLMTSTAAIHNAPVSKKRFPLIIYAPSFGKSAIQNNIACEYLASHGYMVASVASAGDTSQVMTSDTNGVEAQVRDMEYIVHYLKKQPTVDSSSIGSFGFSWGGFSNVIHQMRNSYVRAVVSWDGSIEYQGYEIAKQMTGFAPQKMTVPFLFLSNKEEDFSEFLFFKSIANNQKHSYRMKKLGHAEFVSYWTFFAHSKANASPYDVESYETICRYTLRFFDKYLKSKNSRGIKLEDVNNPIITKRRIG